MSLVVQFFFQYIERVRQNRDDLWDAARLLFCYDTSLSMIDALQLHF